MREKNIEMDMQESTFLSVRQCCSDKNGNNKNNQYRNK